jgi:hypothetical protein
MKLGKPVRPKGSRARLTAWRHGIQSLRLDSTQSEPAVNCIGKERHAQTQLAQLGGEGNFPTCAREEAITA